MNTKLDHVLKARLLRDRRLPRDSVLLIEDDLPDWVPGEKERASLPGQDPSRPRLVSTGAIAWIAGFRFGSTLAARDWISLDGCEIGLVSPLSDRARERP